MELEPAPNLELPPVDRRRHMPEPLPVKLVAVEDVWRWGCGECESNLDHFYVDLLGFERQSEAAYRAENFSLRFQMIGRLEPRESLRPVGIEVLSLGEVEAKLIAADMPYVRQRAMNPGQESLLLKDPAGNWVELIESKPI